MLTSLCKLLVMELVAEKLDQRATRWNQCIAGLAKQALLSAQYCKLQALPRCAESTAMCCFSRRSQSSSAVLSAGFQPGQAATHLVISAGDGLAAHVVRALDIGVRLAGSSKARLFRRLVLNASTPEQEAGLLPEWGLARKWPVATAGLGTQALEEGGDLLDRGVS